MKIIEASTEAQREQSRVLINSIMPTHQYILQEDRVLIPIENREKELSNPRELFILIDKNMVMGTLVLEFTKNEAYILYLTRHQNSPKGSGKLLLKFAENKAIECGKIEALLSIVYHPKCEQQRLEEWYSEQGYQKWCETIPSKEQQEAWKPEFQTDARFKYLKKTLQNIKI